FPSHPRPLVAWDEEREPGDLFELGAVPQSQRYPLLLPGDHAPRSDVAHDPHDPRESSPTNGPQLHLHLEDASAVYAIDRWIGRGEAEEPPSSPTAGGNNREGRRPDGVEPGESAAPLHVPAVEGPRPLEVDPVPRLPVAALDHEGEPDFISIRSRRDRRIGSSWKEQPAGDGRRGHDED